MGTILVNNFPCFYNFNTFLIADYEKTFDTPLEEFYNKYIESMILHYPYEMKWMNFDDIYGLAEGNLEFAFSGHYTDKLQNDYLVGNYIDTLYNDIITNKMYFPMSIDEYSHLSEGIHRYISMYMNGYKGEILVDIKPRNIKRGLYNDINIAYDDDFVDIDIDVVLPNYYVYRKDFFGKYIYHQANEKIKFPSIGVKCESIKEEGDFITFKGVKDYFSLYNLKTDFDRWFHRNGSRYKKENGHGIKGHRLINDKDYWNEMRSKTKQHLRFD